MNRFGQLRDFVGMANFRALLDDPNFIASLWRTGIWTVAVVGGAIICSVPVALVLNEDFYGRNLARVIVMLPWAVSLTMTAIVWRWALSVRADAELGLTRIRHHRSERPRCRGEHGISDADPHRYPRHHPFHGHDYPRRPHPFRMIFTRRLRWKGQGGGISFGTSRCR